MFLILHVWQFTTQLSKVALVWGYNFWLEFLFVYWILNWKPRGFSLLQLYVFLNFFGRPQSGALGFAIKCKSVYQSVWYSEEKSPESLKTCSTLLLSLIWHNEHKGTRTLFYVVGQSLIGFDPRNKGLKKLMIFLRNFEWGGGKSFPIWKNFIASLVQVEPEFWS